MKGGEATLAGGALNVVSLPTISAMASNSKTTHPPDHAPIFTRADWRAAVLTTLVSGAVYFYTAQPNVGLLDSGEFIVAAQHFGVPHPTGYPLWTILAWLFTLLPIGNEAWEVNLFSGFCGALAVGVTTILASSMLRWMAPWWGGEQDKGALWRGLVAVTFGLLFAFSFSFWTQAVIAEVYTLHGLMVGLYITSIYWWVRRPEKDLPILAVFFTFSLAMSNHHLTLALAPLPLLVPLILRRSVFWEVFVAAMLSAALVYLGFSYLSKDETTWSTAMRFFYFALLALIILLAFKWRRADLKIILLVPLVVVVGLLPYAYMPLASSTNPPMNWGYTRTSEGFFYSINRTQYAGSLSDLIVRTLGRAMGTAPEKPPAAEDPERISTLALGKEFTIFYFKRLVENFTWWSVFAFAAAFVGWWLLPWRQRTFLLVLFAGFLLSALLQPIMERTETTIDAWSLQFPYHGYAYLIFALVAATGTGFVMARVSAVRPGLQRAVWLLPLLPLWTGWHNAEVCSQRGHWFGWEYGHMMLKDLPEGAFVFGGTDPGRFVPTYMILGESFVKPKHRRDPDFDRRDLVIVTQNALADAFYQRYIHDHYGPDRPEAQGWFEHWLGRHEQYPEEPTVLPNEAELMDIVRQVSMSLPPGADPQDPAIGVLYHAGIAEWIFQKNKDQREFFIEESFPMEWSYAYAVPHGLLYRLNPEPLEELPASAVEEDFRFWNAFVDRLLGDPKFHVDFDAKRSFSKLRNTTGNIYRWRKMWPEAERAYRQALQLHANNMESLLALSEILRAQRRWEEMTEIWDRAMVGDPNNRSVRQARGRITRLRELDREISMVQRELSGAPGSPELVSKLLALFIEAGQPEGAVQQLKKSAEMFGDDPQFLQFAVEFCNRNGLWVLGLELAERLTEVAPDDAAAWLAYARFQFANRQPDRFLEAARRAVRLGGVQVQSIIAADPMYAMVRNAPEFQQLLQPQ